MTTFTEAVAAWKDGRNRPANYGLSYRTANQENWEAYRGIYSIFEQANAVAITESERNFDRLVCVSRDGIAYALYSEGKCYWRDENGDV